MDPVLKSVQKLELSILLDFDKVCKSHGLVYWLDGGTLLGAIRHKGFIPWDDDIDIAMPRDDYVKFLSLSHHLSDQFYIEYTTGDEVPSYSVPCKIRHKFSKIVKAHPDSLDDQDKGIFIDIIPIDQFQDTKPGFFIDKLLKSIYRTLSKIHYRSVSLSSLKMQQKSNQAAPLINSRTPVNLFRKLILSPYMRIIQNRKNSSLLGYGFDVYWTRIFKSSDIFPLQKVIFEDHAFYAPKNIEAVLCVFYGQNYLELPDISTRQPKHIKYIIIDNRSNNSREEVKYSQG